jgi:hypothetical protein
MNRNLTLIAAEIPNDTLNQQQVIGINQGAILRVNF